ncbi:neutral/alkaline non-lysosomal ceramidase N-terminal domain-containing protein [Pontibacter sp. 172403-2]|uniref:neutral/alkaline non-lysosomal ceramidase N-terminal domain-containing protein n=1 Tax=Pontibacter rufus TaxID=2791028 RepID=UPI0018AFDD7D|nr:neutral/alkaline non-lysosomal ceramidase N-terminal domain-containing protein [Pontibacter sp. 172403-2]MBF9254173.1 neutral/alkaline non-lysosomal ceramidase N-terminal domain-containing protein [Pontibacter sp. 172403-2]
MLKRIHCYTSLSGCLCWLLLLCQSCVVPRLDERPYAQTAYYKKTIDQLQQTVPEATTGDTLQVGWAKVNITPPVGTPMAGYGKRRGMRYEQVHDSAWARTFAFSNGSSQAYLVSLDMLIAPMRVAALLEQAYPKLGLQPGQVYLTATHTHTSFGGWQRKLAGRIMAGKYNPQVVQQTVQAILQSIQLAQQNRQPARIGYGQVSAAALVRNRLTGATANLDSTLRFIKFEQTDGNTAILCTFAAHPTILPSMQPVLSRDYPGELVDALEKEVTFAAFAAGAVGSHQAVYTGETFESTAAVGRQLAQAIQRKLPQVAMAYTFRLGSAQRPLYLPQPQWRIGEHRRFAPGLFYTFFGKYTASVNLLQLGNIVLLGVPADYSGEFMPLLEAQAARQNQHVLLTGFNGGYVGYIIPDEHYQLHKYEARAMNFFGPHAGSYLTDILLQLLKRSGIPATAP